MRKILTVVVLAGLALATQTGCATYVAVRMPGPSGDENIQIGMHRAEVEAILRAPAVSQFEEDEETIVRYEYSDGVNQASKARTLVYIAGDVFTLFLTELVFWPVELYAAEKIKRNSTATYDPKNYLVDWKVQRTNGETLVYRTKREGSYAAQESEAVSESTEAPSGPPDVPIHPPNVSAAPPDLETPDPPQQE